MMPPLPHSLSPAFAEAASRRQASEERGGGGASCQKAEGVCISD